MLMTYRGPIGPRVLLFEVMVRLPEVETFLNMFAVFATTQGVVREGACAACLKYLVENPRVYQFAAARVLTEEMIVQVERALLEAFAAAGVERGILATARPSLQMLMARPDMSFSPKVPLPQAQAAIMIALCCDLCFSMSAMSHMTHGSQTHNRTLRTSRNATKLAILRFFLLKFGMPKSCEAFRRPFTRTMVEIRSQRTAPRGRAGLEGASRETIQGGGNELRRYWALYSGRVLPGALSKPCPGERNNILSAIF
jgi:hypothetical protein